MRTWYSAIHWIHDNILLIFFLVVCAMFLAAWLILEAFRSHRSRDEIFRLRQRLYTIEREQSFVRPNDSGPMVLSSRWIGVGAAATTSDGGCLILLEASSPFQKRASLTVRIDGLPSKRNEAMLVGQRIEVDGRSGTYSIELHATDQNQARFAVFLRTHHLQYAPESGA